MSNGELITTEIEGNAPSLRAIAETEMQQAIDTAKRYPRDLRKFQDNAEMMACVDSDTAEQMFYVLKRGGKQIEGPSVRLAEILASTYGNMRTKSEVVEIGETTITARGIAVDLENNVATSVDVTKRITDRNGKRYNDDMIAVASNAACSTAMRNAILKVVPRVFADAIMKKAKAMAVGKVESVVQNRIKMMEHFGKLGVSDDQVLTFIGKVHVDHIDAEDIATLRGVANAIKEGEQTIEDVFPPKPADVDWSWFDEKISKIMSPRELDVWRNELIEIHPQEKQKIWDRCEEHREQIENG